MIFSVIIPLAADETEHKKLLASLPAEFEVILSQKETRALSLNDGAKKATGEYLWFLHADSRLSKKAISALIESVRKHPSSLLYFNLAFENDATSFMCLNALGVHFRSKILQSPFGDQGFCIHKDLFEQIGGFPENLPYGEDNIFAWKARQHGIKLRSTGAKIYTSARKYKKNGWLKTTLKHQYLWITQSFPEWIKLMRMRKKI
ncbi:MAG: glycosyltransferase [Rickettsiales bacterium]|jgi:GT2 family glycosyltransferase